MKNIKKNYLTACTTAIVAGFTAINFYPEHHGLETVGRLGLLVLSTAILGLLAAILYQGFNASESDEQTGDDGTTTENSDSKTSVPTDPARLKKMTWLWSFFSILLSVSLIRYPIWEYTTSGGIMTTKSIASISIGVSMILIAVVNFATTLRK